MNLIDRLSSARRQEQQWLLDLPSETQGVNRCRSVMSSGYAVMDVLLSERSGTATVRGQTEWTVERASASKLKP